MDSKDLLKQIAEHDAVIDRGAGDDLYDQQVLAYALMDRADCLVKLGRIDEALGDWATLRQRFGASSDGDLLAYLAAAAVAKGSMLHAAERFDEALAAYDDAYALGERSNEPALHEQIVAALYRKAWTLSEMEFSSDAMRTASELINRYGDDPPGEALPDVANAMLLVVPLACVLGQEDKALLACEALIAHLGDEDDESVRKTVGRARIGRAALLGQQGQLDEAIQACDGVLADIGETPEGLMVSIRALALVERGDLLRRAGRHQEAVRGYQAVLDGFSDGQDPDVDAALIRAREGLNA
jgi:tetratricopeptide (TPR) repeat protein